MIVSNSTPLINFAAIGRLDILETLFTTLTIPPAVEHELLEHAPLSVPLDAAAWDALLELAAFHRVAPLRPRRA